MPAGSGRRLAFDLVCWELVPEIVKLWKRRIIWPLRKLDAPVAVYWRLVPMPEYDDVRDAFRECVAGVILPDVQAGQAQRAD